MSLHRSRGGPERAGAPRLDRAVRSDVGGPSHAGAGALLSRVPMDAHVVEVQAPPRGRRFRDRPPADVRVDARDRGARAVQPAHAAYRFHLCVAAERALGARRALRRAVRLPARQDAQHGDPAPATIPEDTTRPFPLRFFCSGDTYEFWGLFEASFHLVCPPEGASLFILGTGPAGPRRAVAHFLRRADLAHHRPARASPSASRSVWSSAASPAISAAGRTWSSSA